MGSSLAESSQLPKSKLAKIKESLLRCREWIRANGSSRPLADDRLPYSMTSSARARIARGTVRPSALAVLDLQRERHEGRKWGRKSRSEC